MFATSTHIACYLANASEFDTTALIETIWRAEKNCYLPVLSKTQKKYLDFAIYRQNDLLAKNHYKILEPVVTDVIFPAAELDLVFLPLTGFDLQGNRLGTGGGYYDRTFAFLPEERRKPLLIGLAYQLQQLDELPQDDWDIKLDGILTEEKLILFKK